MVDVYEFVDEGLGHSSYLVAFADGTAAVVDPPRFPTAQEDLADELGVRIVWAIDTHSHADYVTGSPGLAARRGAEFVAPKASQLASPHRPLVDGEHVMLGGDAELVAIATPGHTPDHVAYLLVDGGAPAALFSGGSLMVGTVGRTDLCGPELAEPLAHDMYRALRRFDPLPDELAVYPTHGAGSFCSAPGSSSRTSTLGTERATNPMFRIRDEDEFVRRLLAGFGTFPTYFRRLPELNRRGPARYDTLPTLDELDPVDVECLVSEGAVVVDGRPVATFAAGHIPGALANTLRPVFASWIGWLVDAERLIVLVLDAEQSRDDAVRQCLDVGYEHLAGVLRGGMAEWAASGRPVARIALVGPEQLGDTIVDVRQHDEYARGHVPGAVNVELGAVADSELEVRHVSVMCGHGERAMSAASILAARGYDVDVLDGGPDTWASAMRRPLERSR